MVQHTLTKIRVESGCISLACRKGTARITTQASPRSILADCTAARDSILELVYLAEPEVPMIEFAFGDDEPSELEFEVALVLVRFTRVRRVVWTSRLSPHASVIKATLREASLSGAGWKFLGATKWSCPARLKIADGDLTVEWKDAKRTYAMAKHPRLLFPSLAAVQQLLVIAKRDLSIPNGARFELVLPEATSELERTALREAAVDAFRSFGQANEGAKPDVLGWSAIETSVVACCLYVLVASALGHEASPSTVGFILIGGSITFGLVEAWWRNRAKTAKLKRLLQPW